MGRWAHCCALPLVAEQKALSVAGVHSFWCTAATARPLPRHRVQREGGGGLGEGGGGV